MENLKKVSTFKKARAVICSHCPACNHARRKPGSLTGRILNHRLHADHCPMWKAYKDVYDGV